MAYIRPGAYTYIPPRTHTRSDKTWGLPVDYVQQQYYYTPAMNARRYKQYKIDATHDSLRAQLFVMKEFGDVVSIDSSCDSDGHVLHVEFSHDFKGILP